MENICTFVNQIEMKRIIKNIVVRPWRILIATSTTWDSIATLKVTKMEIRKQFVFPWIVLCVLTVLFFKSFYTFEKPLEIGIINAIITTVSLVGGYFLSNTICFWYLRKQYPEKYSAIDCEKIVSYSFITFFIIKIITTIFPSLFFIQILNIYTAYLVWEGCRAVLKLNEDERGNIVLVFTLSIIFIPILIAQIIHFMLPNA